MMLVVERLARLLRLRRLRAERAERRLRACRAELDAGLRARDDAKAALSGWDRASEALEAWSRTTEPAQLARWATVADARRVDVARSRQAAAQYLSWSEGEVERLGRSEGEARAAWLRERARCDALERRLLDARRQLERREEDGAFQELADAAAAGSVTGEAR